MQSTVEHDKMMLTDENIRAINSVLAKDQRVELIPTERGVRVIHVQRKEIKGATADGR